MLDRQQSKFSEIVWYNKIENIYYAHPVAHIWHITCWQILHFIKNKPNQTLLNIHIFISLKYNSEQLTEWRALILPWYFFDTSLIFSGFLWYNLLNLSDQIVWFSTVQSLFYPYFTKTFHGTEYKTKVLTQEVEKQKVQIIHIDIAETGLNACQSKQ